MFLAQVLAARRLPGGRRGVLRRARAPLRRQPGSPPCTRRRAGHRRGAVRPGRGRRGARHRCRSTSTATILDWLGAPRRPRVVVVEYNGASTWLKSAMPSRPAPAGTDERLRRVAGRARGARRREGLPAGAHGTGGRQRVFVRKDLADGLPSATPCPPQRQPRPHRTGPPGAARRPGLVSTSPRARSRPATARAAPSPSRAPRAAPRRRAPRSPAGRAAPRRAPTATPPNSSASSARARRARARQRLQVERVRVADGLARTARSRSHSSLEAAGADARSADRRRTRRSATSQYA